MDEEPGRGGVRSAAGVLLLELCALLRAARLGGDECRLEARCPGTRALEQADDLEHSDLSGVSASRVAEACSARRAAMEVAAHIAELEADEARAEWRLSDGRQ